MSTPAAPTPAPALSWPASSGGVFGIRKPDEETLRKLQQPYAPVAVENKQNPSAHSVETKPGVNRQIVLKKRVVGAPGHEHFELKEVPLPVPKEGEVLVRNLFLSVDPYIRGRIGADTNRTSRNLVPEGGIIVGGGVGEVVQSNYSGLNVGDKVFYYPGWQEFYTVAGKDLTRLTNEHAMPWERYLGVLGMPGLTAYYGLKYIGTPQPGETLVVSAASGAVGMNVCQIGKIMGCRVVAIAGSDDKVKFLRDNLKVDAVINYKTEDLKTALDAALPFGVDVYFDNTGGEIYDEVMQRINYRARIVICGQISDYNNDEHIRMGPRLNHMLLWRSAKMQGFLVSDYYGENPQAVAQLSEWIKKGQLISVEDYEFGIDKTVDAFLKLFQGANFGKQVVKISNPSS